MVVHQETSGHKMALSMADLSVWCYLCDSYLDNHVSTECSRVRIVRVLDVMVELGY